jgi:hypothetical protein
MYADFLSASPVTQHLLREIVSQPGNENRNNLGRGIFDQFSNAWLRRQL